MSKIIFAVLAIWTTFSGQSHAASLSLYFSGYVTSDTQMLLVGIPGSGDFQVSTVPSYAVGDHFTGVETFSDTNVNAITNSTFVGLLQPGQSAFVNIYFPGASTPYTLGDGLFSGEPPQYATFTFAPAQFAGAIDEFYREADRTQNSQFLLSQNGSQIDATLQLGSAGSATFGRTLTLDVTNLSTVPLPPALPMFAAGLLALGVFGFVGRRKGRTVM